MAVERGAALADLLSRRHVTAVTSDSRSVTPGALFVALPGLHTDGRRFVDDAIARGAVAVIVEGNETLPAHPSAEIVCVEDSKRALSQLAAAFYGNPSHALDVIGVTGTNGKTTTTRMIAAILNEAAIPCGVIGTVGAEFAARTWQLGHTTPLPPELHGLLAGMREAGAQAVAMEVSSHALALERVDDVRFAIAVLTNVTRDHLDFHGSLEAYAAAKRRLLEMAPRCVINADDPVGNRWMREEAGHEVLSYGERSASAIAPHAVVLEPSGSRFIVNGQPYELHVPGRFNVSNALAAIGVAQLLGIDGATIARGLAALATVPGRMERLHAAGIDVVIDYAHTPDALEHALRALRETTHGALSLVFGCGGDRDRGKRPEMGAIAARLADRIFVTNDNPRTENPQAIADEIVAGVGARPHTVELDRRAAIERAIAGAARGDVVLVAGKGHENYQILGERVMPFDDRVIAREALTAREAGR